MFSNFINRISSVFCGNKPVVVMNDDENSFCYLSISKGSESTESVARKNYVGIAKCKILCVNPTKAQIKEFMGYEPNEEPVYTGTQEIDGKQVPYARICFVVKANADDNGGVETTQMLNYFIRNEYRKGSQSGKYQVIDAYGRTAWATKETIDAKEKIIYSNGPAQIASIYRPCYVGEADLVDFFIKYLGIPAPANYVNGSWVEKSSSELQDCMCQLDCIKDYFKGNFNEIKEAISLQPNNKVKVLFGIREYTDANGNSREGQTVYPTVLKNNVSNYERLQKEIEDRKNAGGLNGHTYEFTEIHEYAPQPTNFNVPQPDNSMPFDTDPWA